MNLTTQPYVQCTLLPHGAATWRMAVNGVACRHVRGRRLYQRFSEFALFNKSVVLHTGSGAARHALRHVASRRLFHTAGRCVAMRAAPCDVARGAARHAVTATHRDTLRSTHRIRCAGALPRGGYVHSTFARGRSHGPLKWGARRGLAPSPIPLGASMLLAPPRKC